MRKLTKAQREAVSVLMSGVDAKAFRHYEHGTGKIAGHVLVSDGGDDVYLHSQTLEWLVKNDLVHETKMKFDMWTETYLPTEKLFALGKEQDVEPYKNVDA